MEGNEAAVLSQDGAEQQDQVNAEVSPTAEPKPAGEVDPQANANEGENEPEHKRKGGFQRRIERQEKLIEQLTAALAGRVPAAPTTPEPPKAEVDPEPDPANEKYQQEGGMAAYIKDTAAWNRREAKREILAEQSKAESERTAKTEQQKLHEAHLARMEAARAKTPDFDEVMADAENIPVSPAMGEAILSSDVSAELTLFLAKNPDEAKRIVALSPARQLVEMGKLEVRLAGEQPATEKTQAPISKAPAPLKSVTKPSATPVPFDPLNPASWDGDFAKYEKGMAELEKKRRS